MIVYFLYLLSSGFPHSLTSSAIHSKKKKISVFFSTCIPYVCWGIKEKLFLDPLNRSPEIEVAFLDIIAFYLLHVTHQPLNLLYLPRSLFLVPHLPSKCKKFEDKDSVLSSGLCPCESSRCRCQVSESSKAPDTASASLYKTAAGIEKDSIKILD